MDEGSIPPAAAFFCFRSRSGGHVAPSVLWGGRACRGGGAGGWAGGLAWGGAGGGNNCSAHRLHRLTVHRYKSPPSIYSSYILTLVRILEVLGPFLRLVSVCPSVCPSGRSPVFDFYFFSFLGISRNLGSLTLTLPGIYRIVRTYRYGSTGRYVRMSG